MNLIGVDWGTSSLRAARIAANGAVLEERGSPRGILTVPAGGFAAVLQDTCGDWLRDPSALCLVSGMAGSRQGWQEAPYCHCPAGFGELGRGLHWVVPGRIAIVPGLACECDGVPDVMRGEEVQVFGALSLLQQADGVVVLPGTHSKWVRVQAGVVQSFSTWMTGEVYALLRRHSILARTMPDEEGPLDQAAFTRGVRHATASGSLLHAAFSTRTLALFGQLEPHAQPGYLSGLVIGEELRVQATGVAEVTLVGSPALTARYALALATLGVRSRALGSEATWRGLWALERNLEAP
ncbi:MAG: 2-dehydro-3-deoxygalactonokinase [Ramlibacter sp.]|nr:2-dehydro-3-deoxygalactonokinase [Ramlibacter sp.]